VDTRRHYITAIIDCLSGLVCWSGPLRRADRPRWAAARTLGDLAELTAQWLEGRIASQPGYYGRVDVDEADAPGLTDTLAALNRAGFLTRNSQAGYDGEGYDGAHWRLHAAVTGFASEAAVAWLRQAVAGRGCRLVVHDCKPRWCVTRGAGVYVTYRDDGNRLEPVTNFGTQVGEATIARELYGCGDEAVAAVCAAKQVTVYDTGPGRNDRLWSVLRAAAAAHGLGGVTR
jgi:hypothetical protein